MKSPVCSKPDRTDEEATLEEDERDALTRLGSRTPEKWEEDEKETWDERQIRIYGTVLCRCGSGRSPEECCG